MLAFFAVLTKQLWLLQNKIWKGAPHPNWTEFSRMVNANAARYFNRHKSAIKNAQSSADGVLLPGWCPPPTGELKLNFDAAFKDGRTSTSVILRNSDGEIKGAWINHFRWGNQGHR